MPSITSPNIEHNFFYPLPCGSVALTLSPFKKIIYKCTAKLIQVFICLHLNILSAAERSTPVLLSASVSDNSGYSPQMAALRRLREIDQSMQRFHVGCDNRCLLGN